MLKKIAVTVFVLAAGLLHAQNGDAPNAKQQENSITINNNSDVRAQRCGSGAGDCMGTTLSRDSLVVMTTVGQGVAPSSTISPAQAKALAKRAAIADGYRQLAEKLNGVRVEGRDYIRNMVANKTEVRTCVRAMIRNASVMQSQFKDGMAEVEMELRVSGNRWYDRLSR
jgi:hypothetical protein